MSGVGRDHPGWVLMVSDHLVKPVAHDWKVTECKLVENEEISKLQLERFRNSSTGFDSDLWRRRRQSASQAGSSNLPARRCQTEIPSRNVPRVQ